MWEKIRVDGKKKLKSSAIPTIFGELVIQKNKKLAGINNISIFVFYLLYL